MEKIVNKKLKIQIIGIRIEEEEERNICFIKSSPDFNKCPLCKAELGGCHIGEYCSDENCGYVDGMAWLTDKEAEKYKDVIIK